MTNQRQMIKNLTAETSNQALDLHFHE